MIKKNWRDCSRLKNERIHKSGRNSILQNMQRDSAPTIEERKKGEWIHEGYDIQHGCDWIHCSVCGKRGINVPADLTNYCPNCGADMRGDKDE